jgi:hypothetical protein
LGVIALVVKELSDKSNVLSKTTDDLDFNGSTFGLNPDVLSSKLWHWYSPLRRKSFRVI